jgi:hypothetical protein
LLITLTPPSDTNSVGESHTVTATITDGGGTGQSGIEVTFEVISGPNQGDTGTGTTSAGVATWTYTGDGGPGTDQIQACFTYEGSMVCSQTVTKVWNQVGAPTITLTPPSDLNLVGEDHTVTATISPAPGDGTTVTFTVISGPNQGDNGTGTTSAGVATWTYTGDGGVGTDEIQACFQERAATVCSNVVQKEWTEEIISLSPLLAQNELNTQHTFTATIQDLKGNPIVGVTVNFSVKQGPNQGLTGTGTTNGSGLTTFTYTGTVEGTDIIRACFTNAAGQEVCTDYGDDTFDNDAFKQWGDPCPAIMPNPPTLPNAVVGGSYSQTITAFGGAGPYTFQVTQGSLPPGLTLNPTTGLLSGTPTQAGPFDFEITATDTNECPGTRPYTLTVNYAPPIPTLSEWGMIILLILFISSSLFYLRRRKDTIRPA